MIYYLLCPSNSNENTEDGHCMHRETKKGGITVGVVDDDAEVE